MKTIIWVWLLLFPLFLATEVKGQYVGYDSVKIVPANPTENDSITLLLHTVNCCYGKKYAVNYNITAGNIWITSCYTITPGAAVVFFTDTIPVGKLPEGIRHIYFTGYAGFDSMCSNNIDTTTVIDSFMVLPIMPVSQKILPSYISVDDDVRVAVQVTIPNPAKKISLNHTVNVSQKKLTITWCFAKTDTTAMPQVFNDTLLIGKLGLDGGYQSYVTVSYSEGDTNICDIIIDSTKIIDPFEVYPVVSVKTYDLIRINVYPNPAQNEINIQLPDGIVLIQTSLQDMQGRTLKNYGSDKQLNISDVPAGLHLLQVETDRGRFVRRFLKE